MTRARKFKGVAYFGPCPTCGQPYLNPEAKGDADRFIRLAYLMPRIQGARDAVLDLRDFIDGKKKMSQPGVLGRRGDGEAIFGPKGRLLAGLHSFAKACREGDEDLIQREGAVLEELIHKCIP